MSPAYNKHAFAVFRFKRLRLAEQLQKRSDSLVMVEAGAETGAGR